MSHDKFLLLKMHPCSHGLSDEAVRQVSETCELIRCAAGEILHRANEPTNYVHFVVHGRIKQSLFGVHGTPLFERFLGSGSEVGALAAASREPSPLQVEVAEPATLLRLHYQDLIQLTARYDAFRQNVTGLIVDAVKHTLLGENRRKPAKLVAFLHQSPASRVLSHRLLKRLQELDQHPMVFSDRPDVSAITDVPYFSAKTKEGYLSESEIREKIAEFPNRNPITFDFDASIGIERVSNVVAVSDKVYWIVSRDNWKDAVSLLADLERQTPSWRAKINIVWLLPGTCAWAPSAPELLSLAQRDFKLSIDAPQGNQSRLLQNGFERLVHDVRGLRIGIALGGGAAKGMAHFGVLKAFEDHGICVDMIAGTSAGAMTGVLYASGMRADYFANCFVEDLAHPWLFRQLPNGGYWYLLYKYRTGQFDPMLRKYLRETRLEQLALPVRSVTVDLISGKSLIRSEGDSVHAILESINLPVLGSPINRDGKALVDGGIINNIPANVLVSEGCNFVIAVSVTAQLKAEFASNNPDTPTSKMKPASVLQTIMRTFTVQNVNVNSVGVAPADFVIEPNVIDFDITAFTRADELCALGERSAAESIPRVKQLLSKIDDQLF